MKGVSAKSSVHSFFAFYLRLSTHDKLLSTEREGRLRELELTTLL